MAHSPMDQSAQGALGLTLAFSAGRATVSLSDRPIGGGVYVEHLELALAEVDVPIDLDGGPEVFQHRSTRVIDLALRIDLTEATEWIRSRSRLPLDRLRLFGEGGHVALEGLWGPEGVILCTSLHPLRELDAAGLSVRWVQDPVLPLGSTSASVASFFDGLVEPVLQAWSGLGARVWDQVERTGVRSVRLDPATAALWALFPRHGWKMPLLDQVALERISVGEEQLVLSYGGGSRRPEAGPAIHARDQEQSIPDETELLVGRGRIRDAVDLLLAGEGPKAAPTAILDRLLELTWSESELESVRQSCADAAAARSPPSALAVLAQTVFDRNDASGWERVASALKARGLRRAAGWAVRCAADTHRDPGRQLQLLEDAVGLQPDDPDLLDQVIDRLAHAGRTQAALRATRRLVRVAPDRAGRAWARAGAWALDDPHQARRLFEQALQAQPNQPEAIEGLMGLDAEEGAWEAAEVRVAAFLSSGAEPDVKARMLASWSQLLRGAGRTDLALQAATDALLLAPEDLQVWVAALEAAREASRPQAVARAFRDAPPEVTGGAPELLDRLLAAAVETFADDHEDLAAWMYDRLSGVEGLDPAIVADAGARLGRDTASLALAAVELRRAEGDVDGAMELLARVAEGAPAEPGLRTLFARIVDSVDPADVPRRVRLADLAAQLGVSRLETDLLVDLMGHRFAERARLAGRLGELLAADGRRGEAARWLEEAVASAHPPPSTLWAWADVLRSTGQAEREVQALTRASESVFEPQDQAEIRHRLAERLGQLGRDEEALQAVRQALAVAPHSKATRCLGVSVAVRMGDWELAEQWGQPLSGQLEHIPVPDRLKVVSELGRAHSALGHGERQVKLLEEALGGLDPDASAAHRLRTQLADTLRLVGDRAALARLRRIQADQTHTPERAVLLLEACRIAMELQAYDDAVQDVERAYQAAEPAAELRRRVLDQMVQLLQTHPSCRDRLSWAFAERMRFEAPGLRERWVLDRIDRWTEAGWVEGLDALIGAAVAEIPTAVGLAARLGEALERQGRLRDAAQAYDQASRRADRAGRPEQASAHAARAADLFYRVGDMDLGLHHDRAVVSLARAAQPGPPEVAHSLARLESYARETDGHAELVEWLERRAQLLPEDRWATRFEQAQVLAHAMGRLEDAVAILEDAEAESPDVGAVWSERSDLLRRLGRHQERIDRWMALAESAPTPRRKAEAHQAAAEIYWNDLDDRPRALELLESAVRIDPHLEDVRRLRWSRLSEAGDARARGRALAMEARLASDNERAVRLWQQAGSAFEEAAAEGDGDPAIVDEAVDAYQAALRIAPQDKKVAQSRVRVRPGPDALDALSVVEKHAETPEERWACRTVRALFKTAFQEVPADTVTTVDRILELLPRLDLGRFVDVLHELGCPVPRTELRAFLLDVGLEASSAREDWRQHARWLVDRAEITEDVHLRAELRLRAGHLFEWKLGDAAAAADEYRAALALSPEHPEARATLQRFLTDENRFTDLADQLGVQVLMDVWRQVQAQDDRQALGVAEALAPRLEAGSIEQSEVLLRLADLYRQFDDGRANEVFTLEQVVKDGPPSAQRAALERLEVLFEEEQRWDLRVEVLRKLTELLDDEQDRASFLARLAHTLFRHVSDPQAAEPEYRAALALDPDCGPARDGLVRLLVDQGRYDELLAELGPEALDRVRQELLDPVQPQAAWQTTEALAAGSPERAGALWLELAEHLDGARRVAAWSQAARAGSVEALDRLRAAFRQATDDESRWGLAELLARLTSGTERADYLVTRAEGAEADRGALLEEALAFAPEHDEARRLWILHQAEEGRYETIIDRFGRPALDALVEHGSVEMQEAALEVRAEAMGSEPEAVQDWLRLSRMALSRDDGELAWQRLGQAIRAGWTPEPDTVSELLQVPSDRPPPLEPALVSRVLDGMGEQVNVLSLDRWKTLVQGVLTAEGADGVMRVAGGRPEIQNALAEASLAAIDELDPSARVEAWMALVRLSPASPQVSDWLESAFETAAQSAPHKLDAVATPWLEMWMAQPDLQAQRAAIERLRQVGKDPDAPEILFASLTNNLDQGSLADALAEAEQLFDIELAQASLRKAAAERMLASLRERSSVDELVVRAQDRAWVELSRVETSAPEERRHALLRLADLRQAHGADAAAVGPLEVALGLSGPEDQLEIRRRLRDLCEEAGDWAGAERHQATIAEHSQNAEAWVALAELRMWLDDPRGVHAALSSAFRHDPRSPGAHMLRVRWAEQQQNWQEALEALTAWAQLQEDSVATRSQRWTRAVEIAARHVPERALPVALAGLKIFGERHPEVEGYARRVAEFLDASDGDAFMVEALRRWPVSPESTALRVELAQRLSDGGQDEAAHRVLRSGLQGALRADDPVLSPWLQGLSALPQESQFAALREVHERVRGPAALRIALEMADRIGGDAERMHDAEQALLLSMDSVAAASELSSRLQQRVDTWEGPGVVQLREAMLEQGVGVDPVGTLRERSHAFVREGRLEQAVALLEEARRTSPTDSELSAELFRLLVVLERYPEADALFDEMDEPEPELVRRRGELVRERLGDSARGARLLAQAFRRQPDPTLGRQATDALLEAQAPQEAADVARQVLESAISEMDRGQAELALAAALQAQGDADGALQAIDLRPGTEAQLVMRAELLLEVGRTDDALDALGEMARDETVRSALDRQLARLRLISEHGGRLSIESVLERLSTLTVDDALDPEVAQETARILVSMDSERAAEWARRAGLGALARLEFEPDDDPTFEAALSEAEAAPEALDLATLERLTQGAHRRGRHSQARRWGAVQMSRSSRSPTESTRVRARRWELQAKCAFADSDPEAGLEQLRIARWLDPELDLSRFREPLGSGPDAPEKAELLEQLAADARGESAQKLWSQAQATWAALGEAERALTAEAAAYAARPSGPVAGLVDRLGQGRRVEPMRQVLRAALGSETLDMSHRMVAARRLVELEEAEDRPSEALAVAQRGLSIRAPATDVALLEASARLAREAGLEPVELDALARLARMSDPDRRQRLLLRQAVLLEASDPDRAIECLEEAQHPSRSAIERLGKLLRRRKSGSEAELWARHATRVTGARKGAAFSRVANLRSADGDRRGARAAWKAAVGACPDDLAFRRGLIEQLVALGERSEARREALDAYRKAHGLSRTEAAFSFIFEGLRLTAELGLHEAERSEWQEALELGVGRRLLLDAMVARARAPEEGADPEGLAQLLSDAIETAPAGPERGELRLALARIYQDPLRRSDQVEALRDAATEDFDGAIPLEDEAEELTTTDLGVSLGQLEVTRNLEARVAAGEARARAAADPVLRSRVWTEVARYHLERREGGLQPAVRALNRAVQAHPMNVKALAELASLEMQQEDWGAARRTLARLHSLGGPSWTAAELELRGAKVDLAIGDSAGAASWLALAEAKDPDCLPVWRGRLAVADSASRGAALDGLLARLEPELDGPEIDRILLERVKVALSSGQTEVAQRAVEALQRRQPNLPGLPTLRRKVLDAVRAPEAERLQALYDESPDDPATLRSLYGAYQRSGDVAGAERVARDLAGLDDPDGLRLAADRFRASGSAKALVSILDRLGGPGQLVDPTAKEVAAWIAELGRLGRGASMLRLFALAEDQGMVDAVLSELSPADPSEVRFWVQPRLELSRDQLVDPRIAQGLSVLNERFDDHTLTRCLADAQSAARSPQASELYRSLLVDAPYDLQLLEGLARSAAPDRRSEVEAIRAYVRTGSGTVEGSAPGMDGWLWPRAVQVLGERAVQACRDWFEAQLHRQRGVRSREAGTFVEGPEGTRIPVVRSESGAFEVDVVFGSTPYVSVGWLGFGHCQEEALRFLASRAVVCALLGGDALAHREEVQALLGDAADAMPSGPEARAQAEGLANLWAMAQVRDMAVAVEALDRWGPFRLCEPPADPAARTQVLSREPLTGLLRAMLTDGLGG